MSRNGAGTYSLPAGNPVVTGTTISSTWANNTLSDIATALTQSIAVDGQSPITANIPFSNHKATGLAAATTAGDAISYAQTGASLAGLTLTSNLSMSGAAIDTVQGADIASAPTINLDTATGNLVDVTGTTTITAVTLSQGRFRMVRFTGILTLTNGASLVLPGGANITTAAGDYALFEGYASSVVRVAMYTRAGLAPTAYPVLTTLTNALAANVAMNNTANYFDGPTVAQGTTGTWLAIGQVTLNDTSAAAQVYAKLWDGTTVIASGSGLVAAVNNVVTITLAGIITSPAGNIKISARNVNNTTGRMDFNYTLNSKDCTLTVIRIA